MNSDINNVGQLGGYLQFVPLTNVWTVSIFHELDLNKIFKNIGTRAGYLAAFTMSSNVMQWLIAYGCTYALHPELWDANDQYSIGHSCWNMSAMSWLPFQILGNNISPVIFKKMCLKKDGTPKWFNLFLYYCLMCALALGIAVVFYIWWNMFLYNVLICKVIGNAKPMDECISTPWYQRPAYFWGFGIGT